MKADVFLIESAPGPAKTGAPGAPRAGEWALLAASAASRGESTTLELEWRIQTPPRAVMAFIPRIKDGGGGLLLDTVFPSRDGKRPYPMIWPLVDDLVPDLHLKGGRTLRQIFTLKRGLNAAPSSAVLELDVFEMAPAGNAVPVGRVTIPISLTR